MHPDSSDEDARFLAHHTIGGIQLLRHGGSQAWLRFGFYTIMFFVIGGLLILAVLELLGFLSGRDFDPIITSPWTTLAALLITLWFSLCSLSINQEEEEKSGPYT